MSAAEPDHAAKLAHMAGQIADFFKAYPEAQAVESLAAHINQFWGGHMRADFLTACKEGRIAPSPLILKALPHITAGPRA
jgi:formate dehydrogenase subunit delta